MKIKVDVWYKDSYGNDRIAHEEINEEDLLELIKDRYRDPFGEFNVYEINVDSVEE